MSTLQFALNKIKNIFNSIRGYIILLMLSNCKKNCKSMSAHFNISYNAVYKFFDLFKDREESIRNYLIELANEFSTNENKGVLVVDPYVIPKFYASVIKNLTYDYNACLKAPAKGITAINIAWTNGRVTIPLNFTFWVRNKELEDRKKYRKKTDFAKILIRTLKNKINFEYIALDGDFGNEGFLSFLHKMNLKYSVRMPSRRKVLVNGIEESLNNFKDLKFIRNQKYKMISGSYKGIPMHFIAHKRKGKRGKKQIVFIVSNLDNLTPKQHVLAFGKRWPIEKMHRTLKQSLGIHQCQSCSAEKQRAHIFATFLAFAELEKIKIYKKKKSPEHVLRNIRIQKPFKNIPEKLLLDGVFM